MFNLEVVKEELYLHNSYIVILSLLLGISK